MNRSGRVTEGAWGLNPSWLGAAARGAWDLAAADMGDKASILLFFGLAGEPALFQLGVKVHGAAVGERAQLGAGRQSRQRFQDLYERLRRLHAAGIHLDARRAGGRQGRP